VKRKPPEPKPKLDKLLDKPVEQMTADELREELLYRRAETDYLKKLEALVRQHRSSEQNDH